MRRVSRIILFLLLLLLVSEGTSRLFWTVRYHLPLFGKPGILNSFYPELKFIVDADNPRVRGRMDVLILGGSVISNAWGNVGTVVREELSRSSGRRISVLNLARPAHTTLDSYWKYRELKNRHFAVVAIYHGINDARTNNCPTDVFKADYSHYSWYLDLHRLRAHSESEWMVLPYTIEMLFHRIEARLGKRRIIPTASPPKQWVEQGAEIKSKATFESNLQRILHLAKERKTRVMLMTFANHLPANYSRSAFQSQSLPYSLHSAPVEAWGSPANVSKAIDVHNEIIRKLAGENPSVLFVDQANLIPEQAGFYNDACHFTARGCLIFGEKMAETIGELPEFSKR